MGTSAVTTPGVKHPSTAAEPERLARRPHEQQRGQATTDLMRRLFTTVPLLALLITMFAAPMANAQSFANGRVADMGLAEVGTRRATGWDAPGECIKSVQRWVSNAGGSFGGGGVLSGYRNSGATQIPVGQATRGDVLQYTNGNDGDWTRVHTVVVVQNLGSGRFSIVQSNAPGYVNGQWRTDYSGLVTSDPNWATVDPRTGGTYAGWYWTAWRFGQVATSDPFGAFDEVTAVAPGTVRVRGWAADPNAKAGPLSVHVYANGQYAGALTANTYRPDVAAAHPGYGTNLGYDHRINLPVSGSVQVCVYGINIGAGSTNTQLGCRTLTVANANPFGYFDEVTAVAPGTVRVRGWAADPNAKAGPLSVHVYANGKYAGALTANTYRPDVAAAFPGYGANLGYDHRINLPVSGSVQVCVYGINQGPGTTNTQLGCRTLNVANPNPFGAFDTVTSVAPKTVRLRGWAADPNAKAGPLSVHVYANGQYAGALTANKSRPDVAAAYPGYGSNLGYDNWITLPVSGSVQVCVYGINLGAGYTNTQLGCRTLTVA